MAPVRTSYELTGIRETRALLTSLPKDTQRELRPAIRKAGELVAAQARVNAHWSHRIPGAIGVRTSFGARTAGASVVVDHNKAPHARSIEGVGTPGDTFRHPIFGRRDNPNDWAEQKKRPFLIPAAQMKERAAQQLVEEAVRSVLPRG